MVQRSANAQRYLGTDRSLVESVIQVGERYWDIVTETEYVWSGTKWIKQYGGKVYRHLIVDPKRFKMPAANFPAESFEGLFYTMDFDKTTEESANCQEHVPFRWDNTTSIQVEIRWLHDSVDAGKVVWGIEYKGIKAGEVVAGAGTSITQASTGSHVAGVEVATLFSDKILYSNLEEDDDLAIRLYRDTSDENDTLGEDAKVINVHFLFTMDDIGKAI